MAEQLCPVCGARRVGGESHCRSCAYAYAVSPSPNLQGSARAEPGTTPPAPHDRRLPLLLVGGVAAAVALGAGVLLAFRDSGASPPVPAATGASETVQQAATVVDIGSGTWSGDMGADGAALSLEVIDGDARGVYRVRTSSGVVGSWNVTGVVDAGSLTLEPGAWISRPSGWSAQSVQLQGGSDGSLEGTASNGDSVRLRLISSGVADAQAVDADWRAALAMTEEQSRAVLEQRRSDGSSARDSLNFAWVPQVASGCEGLDQGSWNLTASSILASNARLSEELGAITVRWDDIATSRPDNCPGTDMWVALVPRRFGSSKAALDWCWRNADSCAARYVVPRGQKGTEIAY